MRVYNSASHVLVSYAPRNLFFTNDARNVLGMTSPSLRQHLRQGRLETRPLHTTSDNYRCDVVLEDGTLWDTCQKIIGQSTGLLKSVMALKADAQFSLEERFQNNMERNLAALVIGNSAYLHVDPLRNPTK